mgnify:CR=1 FL=1
MGRCTSTLGEARTDPGEAHCLQGLWKQNPRGDSCSRDTLSILDHTDSSSYPLIDPSVNRHVCSSIHLQFYSSNYLSIRLSISLRCLSVCSCLSIYILLTTEAPVLVSLQAINSPTPENEDAAWEAILPAVDQLKEFYDYSNELTNQGFIPLLQKLATGTPRGASYPPMS